MAGDSVPCRSRSRLVGGWEDPNSSNYISRKSVPGQLPVGRQADPRYIKTVALAGSDNPPNKNDCSK